MDAAMSPLPASETWFEQWLTDRLYRAMCPSSLELGEYESGLLIDTARLQIELHLRDCPACRKEINFLRDFFVAESIKLPAPVPDSTLQTMIKRLVARLRTAGNDLGPQPAWGALRGTANEPLVFSADSVEIVIEVQENASQPLHKTLLGLVLGVESNQDFLVQLSQNDQVIASTPLDPFGNFVFPSLTSGNYQLILTGNQLEILIEQVTV
ncbi:MAG: hypothetical protein U0175_06425 [Caldilineaceae bacterium]